jgi:hypothetical protein
LHHLSEEEIRAEDKRLVASSLRRGNRAEDKRLVASSLRRRNRAEDKRLVASSLRTKIRAEDERLVASSLRGVKEKSRELNSNGTKRTWNRRNPYRLLTMRGLQSFGKASCSLRTKLSSRDDSGHGECSLLVVLA